MNPNQIYQLWVDEGVRFHVDLLRGTLPRKVTGTGCDPLALLQRGHDSPSLSYGSKNEMD